MRDLVEKITLQYKNEWEASTLKGRLTQKMKKRYGFKLKK